jgi:hypothetical protein
LCFAIRVANTVIHAAIARAAKGDTLEIEFIQDLVETNFGNLLLVGGATGRASLHSTHPQCF